MGKREVFFSHKLVVDLGFCLSSWQHALTFWGILDRADSFENPVLQQHFRNLEALALDKKKLEQAEDLTSESYWRV